MPHRIIFELIDDQEIWENRIAIKIYRKLWAMPKIYHEPQSVKSWWLASQCKTNGERVKNGLDLLIAKGYVIDCGRDEHGTRKILLTLERQPPSKDNAA